MSAPRAADDDALLFGPLYMTGLLVEAGRLYLRHPYLALGSALLWAGMGVGRWALLTELGAGGVTPVATAVAVVTSFFVPAVVGSLLFVVCWLAMGGGLGGRTPSRSEIVAFVRREWIALAAAGLFAGVLATALYFLSPFRVLVQLTASLSGLGILYGPPILGSVLAIEGGSLGEAWARTKALMRGHWLRVVAYMLTVFLSFLTVHSALARGVASFAPDSDAAVVALLEGFAGLLLPYLAAAWLVTYLDVRVRSEALDRPSLHDDLDHTLSPQAGLTTP